jgi:hypothetical protein
VHCVWNGVKSRVLVSGNNSLAGIGAILTVGWIYAGDITWNTFNPTAM